MNQTNLKQNLTKRYLSFSLYCEYKYTLILKNIICTYHFSFIHSKHLLPKSIGKPGVNQVQRN